MRVEDTLKDLLEAEKQAERIVQEGEREAEDIMRKARADAQAIEQKFVERIPELHQSFIDKAHDKAQQTIAEIKLRYDERNTELRELAETHSDEAVEISVRMILSMEDEV